MSLGRTICLRTCILFMLVSAMGSLRPASVSAAATAFSKHIQLLVPSDGVPGDRFGTSLAVSPTTVVVGAPEHDAFGSGSGAAYVFDAITGAELWKLTSPDGKDGDRFGISVAIQGDRVLVGSLSGTGKDSSTAGAAYLYDLTTGQMIRKFTAHDGRDNDRFGSAVATRGTFALIGSPRNDQRGLNAGAAYLFDVNSGEELQKLMPSDGAPGDNFGAFSIGMSDTHAVIGAWLDDDLGPQSGSAYVFDLLSGNQVAKLLPADERGGDFGAAVHLNGSTAVVGTMLQNSGSGTFSGAAYLFDAATGIQKHKLVASDSAAFDQFGQSAAIGDEFVIVGAPYKDTLAVDAGAAYVFDRQSGMELFKITPSIVGANDLLGSSVAVDGAMFAVGAPHRDNGSSVGKVYLVSIVPEPAGSAMLTGSLLMGLCLWGRRNRRQIHTR